MSESRSRSFLRQLCSPSCGQWSCPDGGHTAGSCLQVHRSAQSLLRSRTALHHRALAAASAGVAGGVRSGQLPLAAHPQAVVPRGGLAEPPPPRLALERRWSEMTRKRNMKMNETFCIRLMPKCTRTTGVSEAPQALQCGGAPSRGGPSTPYYTMVKGPPPPSLQGGLAIFRNATDTNVSRDL